MGLSAAEELLLRITGDATGGVAALTSVEGSVQKVSGTLKQSAIEGGSAEEQFQRLTSTVKTAAVEALGPFGIAGAAVVGVMGAMVFQAIEAGSALNDFSEITSITVEHASALEFAGKVAGASLQDLGNLIFNTQKRMAENPEDFERGLKRIGLTINDLKGLDPDAMFLKIASAFRENTDATNRAATATELWSRQGRDAIPLLMKPLEELTDKARTLGHVMSTEDAAAAEELTMKWNELKAGMSWMITDTGLGILHFFDSLGTALHSTVFLLDPFMTAAEKGIVSGRLIGDLPKVKDITESLIPPITNLTMKQWESDLVSKQLTESTKKLMEANQKYADALREYTSAGTSYESLLRKIGNATYEGIAYDHERGISVETLASVYKVSKTQINQVIDLEKDAAKDLKTHLDNMTESEKEGAEGAKAVALGFAGGQNVLQSLSVQLGNTTLAGRQFNTDVLGVMPDLSRQATQRIYELEGGVRSWSQTLDQALTSLPKMIVASFTGGGGFVGAMKGLTSSVGASIFGEEGPLGFGAGGLMNSFGNKLTSMFGTGFGAMLPGLGGAIGSLIGPLVGKLFSIGGPSKDELEGRNVEAQFQKQFGSFQDMMTAVGAAYQATGRSAQQAQADVKALMDAERQGGAAAKAMADQIQSAFDEQKQDATDLAAAVERYGFSIGELGPLMQKQQLDEQAKVLINDWRLLVNSGIDVVNVDTRMAESMNKYLSLARQTGQEVPAAMKPIIQSMIQQGLLTDEGGEKIVDLQGIGVTFSETMTQGFDRIVKKLDDLLNKIGMIPAATAAAASSIPDNPFAGWHVPDLDFNMPAIPMAAGGMGRVTRPTLFLAGDSGPEDVAFSGGGKSFSGGGVTVNVDASGSMFRDRASLNELAEMVGDAISDKLRLHRQIGLRTA